MTIGWPQGIYLALVFIRICIFASKNGQPRTGHFDLGAAIFMSSCFLGLLYWGGFFR